MFCYFLILVMIFGGSMFSHRLLMWCLGCCLELLGFLENAAALFVGASGVKLEAAVTKWVANGVGTIFFGLSQMNRI